MHRQAYATAAYLLIGLYGQVNAAILPSFHLDFSAWKATDVVVIDLEGRVVESWKGGLTTGDKLPIGTWKLTGAADINYGWREQGKEEGPKGRLIRVSGVRRVLFLIRNAEKAPHDSSEWEAASIGRDVNTCAVWLEKEDGFAIQQWMNPGPALMHPLGMREVELQREVQRLAKLQQSLHSIEDEPNLASRAQMVVPLLKEEMVWALNDALDVLKGCGKDAWPVIKSLLDDDKRLSIHSELVHAAGDACIDEAIPVFERILGDEMKFWSEYGATKEQGLLIDNASTSLHYERAGACLCELQYKRNSYRDEQGIVATLRKQLDASPHLQHLGTGPTERSPLLKYADAILSRIK